MIPFDRPSNPFKFLSSIWLIISYTECAANESQRYPHSFWKCCEPTRNASAYRNPTSHDDELNGPCRRDGSEILLLPKKLFPGILTDSEWVEVRLWESAEELKCDEGQNNLDISFDLVDNETSGRVYVDKKNNYVDVTFSGENFVDWDGNIYSRHHFCVSSRTTNKTRLVIKTCKRQRCRRQHPCIPRCCGGPGHQSILTTRPTSHNESVLDFCSTPTLAENFWDPYTSQILRIDNGTRFHQKRYDPHVLKDGLRWDPEVPCTLSRFNLEDKRSLTFLENGRILLGLNNKTLVLDDICIDGTIGDAEWSSPGDTQDTLGEEEVMVAYFCSHRTVEGTLIPKPISLPACSDLEYTDQILQLPLILFTNTSLETKLAVAVVLTTDESNEGMKCEEENLIIDIENSTEKHFIEEGWLNLKGVLYPPSFFCIRRVSPDALEIRWSVWMCKKLRLLISTIEMLGIPVSVLYFVAIAVVYILRKDLQPVFRCSIVAFSISKTLSDVLFPTSIYLIRLSTTVAFIIVELSFFFNAYTNSWMSVLTFDVWLNITFLRPGRKSRKWFWGYVVFTFTFATVFVGLRVTKDNIPQYPYNEHTTVILNVVLGYLIYGPYFMCLNLLLFIATALKLWITQHSSDIKNQKKTFLLYLKLFLLMGLKWVTDLVDILYDAESIHRTIVDQTLMLLHPICLFFFLVWDVETKKYMKTNHPRVKRALDFIGAIGYPVRKCWGLRTRCKQPKNEGTSGDGAIEPPHCSTHMYVHRGRTPNIPK